MNLEFRGLQLLACGAALLAGCSDNAVVPEQDGTSGGSSTTDDELESSSASTAVDESTGSGGSESTGGGDDLCGNWQPDPGEVCDDGNNEDGDGCSADCTEATCWVPATHPTIQAAVDDPECPTVWLAPEIHHEHVVVTRDVELVGPATIDGSSNGRPLQITRGVNVLLRQLTISHGSAELGGGIYSEGSLELEGSQVTGNDATGISPCGGGIWTDGDVVLRASEVSANESLTVGTVARGAGICMDGGLLELRDESEVSSNFARANDTESARGAGIHAEEAEVLITEGSFLYYNRAEVDDAAPGAVASGGGIYQIGGTLTLAGAQMDTNGTSVDGVATTGEELLAEGGAMWLAGVALEISDSTLRQNLAIATGAPVLHARGGALHLENEAAAAVTGTLFESNSTLAVADLAGVTTSVLGGAIHVAPGDGTVTLDVFESQFTRNRVTTYSMVEGDDAERYGAGGAVFASAAGPGGAATIHLERTTLYDSRAGEGGAIFVATTDESATAELDLVNTTIYDNDADFGAALAASAIDGNVVVRLRSSTITRNDTSGLWIDPDSLGITIDLANTILFDNGNDCEPASASIASLGHNAFGPVECTLAAGPGDLFPDDAGAGLLQDNGGPTLTCALDPDSPLRNAGDPLDCVGADASSLLSDQRGEDRHAEGRCDIGAFEYTP